MIRVQMLGRFTIFTSNGEVRLPTSKTILLAAYLFWKQGQWVGRDFLRSMLWPEADEHRAAVNLRQTIHRLKKALGESSYEHGVLEYQHGAIRIPSRPDIYVDAHIFEKRAREGLDKNTQDIKSLTAAASIYRGNFLEGISEDWCMAESRRLAGIHIEVLKALVEILSLSGIYQVALSYAYRWLAEDPVSEEAHRALIRLYASMGQPTRAMEQFESCRKVLETELGIAPSEETINLCKELGVPEYNKAEKASAAKQRRTKHRQVKNLPDDILRNASFLIVYGEDKALQGDIREGISSLKKALSIYKRHGTSDDKARVYLAIGSSLLYTPMEPDPVEALKYIRLALEHYRALGISANLCRALLLAADALWQCGQNDESAALSEEGLRVAGSLNDKYFEASFSLTLGIVRTMENRIKEAKEYFEGAAQTLSCFSDIHDVLKFTLHRGILAGFIGDYYEVERFMRETIAIAQLIDPTPRIKLIEYTARAHAVVSLFLQDRLEEVEGIMPPIEAFNYEPIKNMLYPLTAFLHNVDPYVVLGEMEAWLRANLLNVPPHYALMFIQQIVVQMISMGINDRAIRWASVGVRLSRSRNLEQHEAAFYSRKAVPLARLGRIKGAELCCRRARRLMDEGGMWIPAYLTWADGLIAKAKGDMIKAGYHLEECIGWFNKMGCKFGVKQIQTEIDNLSLARSGSQIN